MSEMLERVKTAIFVSADDAHNTWSTPDHPECVKMAKAAICAMKTASFAATALVEVNLFDDDAIQDIRPSHASNLFRQLIDEALK